MKSLIFHPFSSIIITIVVFFISFSLYQSKKEISNSTQVLTDLKQEIYQISDDVYSLEGQINQAKTPFAKEKIARDELLMQKDGEIIIQLPTIEETNNQQPTTSNQTPWEAWRELLF